MTPYLVEKEDIYLILCYMVLNSINSISFTKFKGTPETIPIYTPDSLILRYTMDNNTNNTGTAGSRYNATLSGTNSFTNSYFMRGTHSLLTNRNSFFNIPNIYLTDETNSNGITMTFWLLKTTLDSVGTLVSFGIPGSNNYFNIYMYGGGDGINYNIYFVLKTDVTKNSLVVAQGVGVNSNNWRFIAITMTKSTNNTSTWKTYIYNQTTLHYSRMAYNMNYPTERFTNCNIGNTDCYMDDFRMYNYVLSDAQILGIYNNTF